MATALTKAQLRALHKHVIDLPNGPFTDGTSIPPSTEEDFTTTTADLDAIIAELERFVTARRRTSDSPVPVVLYAHGGLIDKAAGLRIAQAQVAWWKQNGVYPIEFVWHTGFAESLWQAVLGAVSAPRGFIDDAWNTVLETAARAGQGVEIWGSMKTKAERVCAPSGGAGFFVEKLGSWMQSHEGWITVHAVGHSAGSIFHSYLVPAALGAGVPRIDSLNLLAPAVRVDTFKKQLLEHLRRERIDSPAIFTMTRKLEEADNCVGMYRSSLLYLISKALEKDSDAHILGLQQSINDDDDLLAIFDGSGRKGTGEIIWSTTATTADARSRSQSTSHGGFDTDSETMTSVAYRILGAAPAVEYPKSRAVGDSLWPPRQEAERKLRAAMAGKENPTMSANRRALCIGIDAYPGKYKLNGCVADAKLWKAAFEEADFTVQLLTDKKATRAGIIAAIKKLITTSKAGDVIALQYSGHGTTLVDANHDEEGDLFDEALCPQDFVSGNLLIDDDLGDLWDLLPEGVSFTTFFDSCHSGGAQRAVPPQADAADPGSRYAQLTASTIKAYASKRGVTPATVRTRSARASTARREEPGFFFAACQPDEVAWESNSQGDFTARAVPLLADALKAEQTNEQLMKAILRKFGANRRQTPLVLVPPRHKNSALLAPLAARKQTAGGAASSIETSLADLRDLRVKDEKVAELLRAIADLIDS